MAKSKFDDLAAQLNQQTEQTVAAKAGSEKEAIAVITTNLNQLKAFIDEGSVSGEDFKQILDAAASISGKTLAEERIGGAAGRTAKEVLSELLDEEEAYNQGKQLLISNAKKLKIDLDTYLADTENPILQQVVAIKDEAERMAAELRVGIKTFAMSLVDQLQSNNTQKSTKTDEELAEWRAAFAPAKSIETGSHESQMTSIVAKFVEEQSVLSEAEQTIRIPELRVSKKTSKEVIWKNYANFARRAAETQFPLKEDEDRCRDFLRKLLDTNNPLCAIDTHSGNTMIVVNKELDDDFSKKTLRPIIVEFIRSRLLSTAQLDRWSLTLDDTMRILAIARSNAMTHESMIAENAKIAGHPSQDLTKNITENTARLETAFLNELDATIQFLFTSIPKHAQEQMTNGVGDYRLFSPLWKGDDEKVTYPTKFVLRSGLRATTEGAIYSPINAADRISDSQATQEKEAFAQQLSDALNKGKLQEDQRAITKKDQDDTKNRGTVAAEQRALAAEVAQKEAEAKLAASELALQAEKDARAAEKTAAEARELLLKFNITDHGADIGKLRIDKAASELAVQEGKTREAALNAKLAEAEKELLRLRTMEEGLATLKDGTGRFMGASKASLEAILHPPTPEQK